MLLTFKRCIFQTYAWGVLLAALLFIAITSYTASFQRQHERAVFGEHVNQLHGPYLALIQGQDLYMVDVTAKLAFWNATQVWAGAGVVVALALVLIGILYLGHRLAVSQRVRTASTLSGQLSDLTVLYESMRGYRSHLDLDRVCQRMLADLNHIIDYSSAALFILEGEQVALRAARGSSAFIEASPCQLEEHARALFDMANRGEMVSLNGNFHQAKAGTLEQDMPPPDMPSCSVLCIPLIAGAVVTGGLVLTRPSVRRFSATDRRLLRIFAGHSAVGIQNTRIALQLQEAAVAAERDRIARDLHDAVAQSLFSASMIAEALPDVWEQDPATAQLGTEKLRTLTRQAHKEMRMLMMELREDAMTRVPVGVKLLELIETVKVCSPVEVCLDVRGDRRLPAYLQIGLYRIVQECLNNVVKHAAARHAHIELDVNGSGGTLRVCDDGVGFDPGEVASGHMGLVIIQERVSQINGTLDINSQPGFGTEVVVSW